MKLDSRYIEPRLVEVKMVIAVYLIVELKLQSIPSVVSRSCSSE